MAVVGDADVDRAAAGADSNLDRCRAAVLADVGERLLHCPEDGDALGRAERIRVASDLGARFDSGSRREPVDLSVDDLRQRP